MIRLTEVANMESTTSKPPFGDGPIILVEGKEDPESRWKLQDRLYLQQQLSDEQLSG